MSRRSFVVVIAASAATISATASANPPAPSSLPDPIKLVSLKPGETPHRLRRHDSGCYVYGNDGPVGKADCVKGIEHAGEEIEREVESGQCVLIEPWNGEPKETECPAILVPAGYVSPTKKSAPAPASLATPPTESKSGCAKCEVTRQGETSNMLLAAGAVGALFTRRASSGSRRRR
jgi:MYXO-CTERM domain-containing protein